MNSIVVVSGLPRSGTSMVMSMLKAGGVQVITDHQRSADIDNPNGYFEYERVKLLKNDNSWLESCKGKAIKIISPLLYYLPDNLSYKIIFIYRDLDEVLASQQKMIMHNNKQKNTDDLSLKSTFKKHLKEIYHWLEVKSNMEILHIEYEKIIFNSIACSNIINDFLKLDLSLEAMANSVNSDLYRNRFVGSS